MGKKALSQEFYTKHYRQKSSKIEKVMQASYLLSVLKQKYFKFGGKTLDAGCGIGILGAKIKKQFKSDVYGIDFSATGIRMAKKNGIKASVNDLETKWKFVDGFFDTVIGQEIIEHLVDPDYFLSEAKRVLKKEGILILTTPNLACWFNRIIFLFGYQPFFLEASTIDKTIGIKFTRKFTPNRSTLGHIRVFTLRALIDLLELHGFEIVEFMGGRVGYLPKFMNLLDSIFINIPSLSTDLIVVVKKK